MLESKQRGVFIVDQPKLAAIDYGVQLYFSDLGVQ